MASDVSSRYSPSLRLGLTALQPSRRHHTQSLLGPLISWPKTDSCFGIPPRASRASLPPQRWATSALTLPLHCASILQTATPGLLKSHSVAFESQGLDHPMIFEPICLNPFALAESRKPDLWTCVCVFTFSSSAFSFLMEVNISFKSCHSSVLYVVMISMLVSWQYQTRKYWTILILVLCLLGINPLVCSW